MQAHYFSVQAAKEEGYTCAAVLKMKAGVAEKAVTIHTIHSLLEAEVRVWVAASDAKHD